ncbi:MAG TPA: Asp-tRNA(Asn)/Glu-tRNA(Gln) amidotransferase subunit GatC [Candidatus Paceibacterota bacterium]|nr:Asp-tRNA(Asn)/Glu-tRNA(Gln) amidotransferase subunit GatC [Candidatus Paceibacterota bacterium]
MISREDIEKLSTLSRIHVTSDEIEALRSEIDGILGYIAQVSDVAGISTVSNSTSYPKAVNVLRPDTNPREPGTNTDALVKAAPDSDGSHIRVQHMF